MHEEKERSLTVLKNYSGIQTHIYTVMFTIIM